MVKLINNYLEITNENGEKFIVEYAGSDLYFTNYDYHEKNEFIINEEDTIFYNTLQYLFTNILDSKVNVFIWASEAYGEEETAHKLIIKKIENKFIISFQQNELNMFCIKTMCLICFCLSGSRNQNIANLFSEMYLVYLGKIRTLKRNLEHL